MPGFFDSFFLYEQPLTTVETGVYQLPLVVLSYIVASFASYTALSMAQQLLDARDKRDRRVFHAGGAFAMGAGIWSMHFIGMLSYKMEMVVSYDPFVTFLSMLIAIAVAYEALHILSQERPTLRRIGIGGVMMGFGICAMHYTGMAAMRMDGDLRYIPWIFFLSFIIASVAAGAALWITFSLPRFAARYREMLQIAAACVMGAAICGMHYTGMASAVFLPYADCRYDPNQNFDVLALSIAFITSIILATTLFLGFYRRRLTEEDLRDSELRLRLIFDSSLDAIISINDRGAVTEWSRQAENVFGWKHAEAVGRPLDDLIIPESYREAHRQGMARFLKEGEGPILNRRRELTAMRKDGSVFPVEVTVTSQRLRGAYYFTAFCRDITDRKESEEKLMTYTRDLERSNRELEDFAHIASHDLKEPLRGLSNLAVFLQEDYGDKLDDQGKAWLKRLTELCKRMENLISDLLYFSMLGGIDMATQETDLNAVVDDIRAMLEPVLKERNAAIEAPVPLPSIVCDKPRVTELLRNLVTNAIKYNDNPEPCVEIGFIEKMEGVEGLHSDVFYVKDNGIGIEPRFHDTVFRIFKKLDTPFSKGGEGTGVGLTFVKKIVERHHGRIWIESAPGKGSTFYFTLKR